MSKLHLRGIRPLPLLFAVVACANLASATGCTQGTGSEGEDEATSGLEKGRKDRKDREAVDRCMWLFEMSEKQSRPDDDADAEGEDDESAADGDADEGVDAEDGKPVAGEGDGSEGSPEPKAGRDPGKQDGKGGPGKKKPHRPHKNDKPIVIKKEDDCRKVHAGDNVIIYGVTYNLKEGSGSWSFYVGPVADPHGGADEGTDTPPEDGTDTPPEDGTDTPPEDGTDTPPEDGTDTPKKGK